MSEDALRSRVQSDRRWSGISGKLDDERRCRTTRTLTYRRSFKFTPNRLSEGRRGNPRGGQGYKISCFADRENESECTINDHLDVSVLLRFRSVRPRIVGRSRFIDPLRLRRLGIWGGGGGIKRPGIKGADISQNKIGRIGVSPTCQVGPSFFAPSKQLNR